MGTKFTLTTNTIQNGIVYDINLNVRHVEDYYTTPTEYSTQYLTDILWPRSTGFLSNSTNYDVDTLCPPQPRWFNWPTQDAGAKSALLITGTTKDSSGNALPYCTVNAYTTADNILRGTTTSDINGNFQVATYISGSHYVVSYRAASGPYGDVAGSTDTNLTGS